jgi:muconate cycloisomerase
VTGFVGEKVAIDHLEAMILDVPTIRPHVLAMATMHVQSMVIVRIFCADGTVGVGEGTTIGGLSYGEESPESIQLTIERYFTPVVLAGDANRPAAIMQQLGMIAVGNRFAKCAIETALLDALGQRRGIAVSELLGGRLHDRLPVLWTLASGNTQKDIAEAEEMLAARRHQEFKLKIGKRALADDVAHVAAIKRALGDRASVRVDVNQAWDECTAQRGIAMLADAGVDLVEQPIARRNRAGMARLRARAMLAIMADEALNGPADALEFAQAGAADVFAVKIAQSGGLRAAKDVAAIADAAGVGVYGGTMLEGGVGTVAACHLFSTIARLPFGTEQFGPLLLAEEILEKPLDYADFSVAVPDGPGLGVALDANAVARFRRDGPNPVSVAMSNAARG